MRFGPTSLRLSGILAKGLHRPRFRTDLKVSRQVYAGEVSYVVKVPEADSFSRLGELDWDVLTLCDGTRTPAEISAEFNTRFPENPLSKEEIASFLDGIDPQLWEQTSAQKNLCILEKIRDERRQRVNSANILSIYFSAYDPDRALNWLIRYTRWLFTPRFFLASLVAFGIAAAFVAADYERVRQDTHIFYSFSGKSFHDLVIMWIILFFILGPHEFAHGLACKHYGGEVHHMGFMLLYFAPAFYTDCTDMHLFDKTSKRIWTIIAGIWLTLWQSCLAIFVYFLSRPGSEISNLAYQFGLIAGILGFLQLNPLMKIDGYYVLGQLLQVDDLFEHSFTYFGAWLKKNILRLHVELPEVTPREKRIYLTYAPLAAVYALLILRVVVGFIFNISVSSLGIWGYPVGAAALYLFLRERIRGWVGAARGPAASLKEELMKWKPARWQWGLGGAAMLAVLAVPFSTKVVSEFNLEPGARAEVRALVPGSIREVAVHEGETCPAGFKLAALANPEIVFRAAARSRELQMAEAALREAEARSDFAAMPRPSENRRRLLAEKAEADWKLQNLTLRSPLAGVVTTPRVEQRVGEYLQEGAPFALVVDRSVMRARVLVSDWDLEDVKLGARADLKVESKPFRTYSGTVSAIMPAASAQRPVSAIKKIERKGQELTNFFEVTLDIANADGALSEGMTGTAKIYGSRRPLAWQAGRACWRWIRSLVW
jgi:putative peptide zinc metalloprotease protein